MYFFKINTNASLFDDLYISGNVKLCEDYLGKYPVISISLKGVEANSYQLAKAQLIRIINHEARRFEFLLENNSLSDVYKTLFLELLDKNMDEATLANSLLANGNPLVQALVDAEEKDGWVRMCNSEGNFVGVYQWDEKRDRYFPVKMF